MRGICLRGQPGWGQVLAPLTTVVNTFGGTWFDKDWNAQVNGPGFTEATNFYVNLVRSHGEIGAAQAGFTECLTDLEQGKVAMWYDATSAAGSLDGKDSPVAGKIGYVQAPVKLTKSSGWLYAWSWAIEKASKNKDDAWKFVDVHESRLPQGRPLVRRADADRYPERQPGLTGRSAATDDRHPVRGHSGVHRLRHGLLVGDRFGDRRQGVGPQRAGNQPTFGRERRQALPEVAEDKRWQHS
jgi:hypothetical protein